MLAPQGVHRCESRLPHNFARYPENSVRPVTERGQPGRQVADTSSRLFKAVGEPCACRGRSGEGHPSSAAITPGPGSWRRRQDAAVCIGMSTNAVRQAQL